MSDLDRVVAGMSCREVLAELSDFLDGELADARAEQVRAHLGGCARCEAFGGAIGGLVASLRATLRARERIDPGVAGRLAERLRRAQ